MGGCFGGPTSDWPSKNDGDDEGVSKPGADPDTGGKPPTEGATPDDTTSPSVPRFDAGVGGTLDAGIPSRSDAGYSDPQLDGGVPDARAPDAGSSDAATDEGLPSCDDSDRSPIARCVGFGCALGTQRSAHEPCTVDGGIRRSR